MLKPKVINTWPYLVGSTSSIISGRRTLCYIWVRSQMQTRANAEIVVYSGRFCNRRAEIQKYKMTSKRIVKNRVQVQAKQSEVLKYKGAGRNRKPGSRAEVKKKQESDGRINKRTRQTLVMEFYWISTGVHRPWSNTWIHKQSYNELFIHIWYKENREMLLTRDLCLHSEPLSALNSNDPP